MTVTDICNAVKTAFNKTLKPANQVPAILMTAALPNRSGLSVAKSTANIITNQSKFGGITGKNPDGTENMTNALINIIVEEVFRALREDCSIQIAIAPSAITVQSNGSNAGGPVVSIGTNILPVKGVGLIQ